MLLVGVCAGCGPGAPPNTDATQATMAVPQSEQSAATGEATMDSQSEQREIGTATIKQDGTLVLNLNIESPEDHLVGGHGLFEYLPNSAHYEAVKRHIGPISVGETKVVYAWPE